MGVGGISVWQLLIVLIIVLMIFGTKKLRNMGGDLGSAIKGFKKAVTEKGRRMKQRRRPRSNLSTDPRTKTRARRKTKLEVPTAIGVV